jgi:hypothetical protein
MLPNAKPIRELDAAHVPEHARHALAQLNNNAARMMRAHLLKKLNR